MERISYKDEKLVAAVRELYLRYEGREIKRIVSEIRAAGWATFNSNILFARMCGKRRLRGWVREFGWNKELDRSAKRADSARARRLQSFEKWLPVISPEMTWTARHFVFICGQLERVTSGEVKRLMLFVPPRHGKSELVTVRYALWRLLREPRMNIIVASYSPQLANRFSRRIRKLAADVELSRSVHSAEEWETAAGGGVKAVGVRTGITGFGGDLIIIDDPVKSRSQANSRVFRERVWDWYTDDICTRLEPGGAVILIQTRWHDDDLAGRLLKDMAQGGEHWEVVRLPALAEITALNGRVRDSTQQAPTDAGGQAGR